MRKIILLFIIASVVCFGQVNDSLVQVQTENIVPLKLSLSGNKEFKEPFQLNLKQVDEFDPLHEEINYTLLAGVGAAALGTGVAVHIYQANAWWKDQRTSFHFANDWDYAIWQDKLGHFFGANFLAHCFSSGFEAGNISSEKSALYGSIGALAFQLYVEIEDGFGAQWGFSPGDAYADILGAAYPYLQYHYPVLKNFLVKFSYYPSNDYIEGLHKGNAIDDYEGQKYWLSVRVKNLLPESAANYWPSFLNLAVGRAVKNTLLGEKVSSDVYIALDFDFEQIPLYGKGWQFVKNTLNYFHLPMPGIRITHGVAFFGLCY